MTTVGSLTLRIGYQRQIESRCVPTIGTVLASKTAITGHTFGIESRLERETRVEYVHYACSCEKARWGGGRGGGQCDGRRGGYGEVGMDSSGGIEVGR